MQPVDPQVVADLMFSWYVWGIVFAFAFAFTIIGTHLVTRGWKE
jgi:hypothetical protein